MTTVPSKPVLYGRYRLLVLIGQGGVGDVWAAIDQVLGRKCVVKRIKPELAQRAKVVQRLRIEGKAMASIDHPNIVQIYDVMDDEKDGPSLIMQLVKGVSIDALPALPAFEALRIVREALRGLAAAHEAGIVHRDIKPGNILIDRERHVRVTDFGIARMPDPGDRMTRVEVKMGTEGYMAPEQRNDAASADARADVYGMGVTLWNLVTRREPHVDFFIAAHQAHEKVSDGVAAIVARATAYNPNDRYTTADAMRTAIENELEATPRALVASLPEIAWLTALERGSPRSNPTFDECDDAHVRDPRGTLVDEPPPSWRRYVGIMAVVLVLALAALGMWYGLVPDRVDKEELAQKPTTIEEKPQVASNVETPKVPSKIEAPKVVIAVERPKTSKSADVHVNVDPKVKTPKVTSPVEIPSTVVEKLDRVERLAGSDLTVIATVVGMDNPRVQIRYRSMAGASWASC